MPPSLEEELPPGLRFDNRSEYDKVGRCVCGPIFCDDGRASLFNHRLLGRPFDLFQRGEEEGTEDEAFDGTGKDSRLGGIDELGRDL